WSWPRRTRAPARRWPGGRRRPPRPAIPAGWPRRTPSAARRRPRMRRCPPPGRRRPARWWYTGAAGGSAWTWRFSGGVAAKAMRSGRAAAGLSGIAQGGFQHLGQARRTQAQLRLLGRQVRVHVGIVDHVALRVHPGGEAGAAGLLDPGQREAGARRAADRFDRRRGQGAQALQPGLLVQPPGGEQAAVPQRVQVAALAAVVDLVVVAAAVVAVA